MGSISRRQFLLASTAALVTTRVRLNGRFQFDGYGHFQVYEEHVVYPHMKIVEFFTRGFGELDYIPIPIALPSQAATLEDLCKSA